ncbi:MAG: hypothetical protein KAF91_31100 [Nostoc sp. TH1S01]|nr:hypothetical protein [Nostoc sp. TH1S01]
MAASVETNATTLEGQLWEVAIKTQLAELAVPADTRPNNIQTTLDVENGSISITFTCPATFTVNATGGLVAVPTPYLT